MPRQIHWKKRIFAQRLDPMDLEVEWPEFLRSHSKSIAIADMSISLSNRRIVNINETEIFI